MKQIVLTEEVVAKWKPVVEAKAYSEIKDPTIRKNLFKVLETTSQVLKEETQTGDSQNFDPVLIALIRRTQPSLVANQLVGVQPMTGPTGLIFIMQAYYSNETTGVRTETWAQAAPDPTQSGTSGGVGQPVATGETLGTALQTATGTNPQPVQFTAPWTEMDFTISKTTVTANTRALKSKYTMELATDLRNMHGLDAETELANILAAEITAEIDREILALILSQAVNDGTFDLNTDTDGRWSVEKYKGLIVYIEREANKIARGTRRGKGNFIVVSADIAGALNMAGVIDTLSEFGGFEPDTTGLSYVGVMGGRYKVYVDPYAATNYVVVGYKGPNVYDAGIFYAPYVPLEYLKATGQDDFQPRIGFKTRYGLVANPFGNLNNAPTAGLGTGNQYFRTFAVTSL